MELNTYSLVDDKHKYRDNDTERNKNKDKKDRIKSCTLTHGPAK